MRLRLLGTASGGGMPQWNCRCKNCEDARSGLTEPLAQCALAFSPDGTGWYLVDATPDVTQQLARWPELRPSNGIRSTPLHGVILTDGELDHVLGLLHLREGMRWTLFATSPVASMLREELRLLQALGRYAEVRVQILPLEDPLLLGGGPAKTEVRLVETGRRFPRYAAERAASAGGVVAVVLTDVSTGGRVVYAPAVGELSEALREACSGADVIFFDGTFWTDDELPRLGIGSESALRMGHVPVYGPEGSARWLSEVPARAKFYVHINNTNPLLDFNSSERAWVRSLGLEVAHDGWEAAW